MNTRYREQEPPYAIQVEASEGCQLYCPFCGLQGIREKGKQDFKFMRLETAMQIASEMARVGWRSRIEFAMHGEPTMNPELPEILHIFRSRLPEASLMVTSNGGGLLKGGLDKLTGNVNRLMDSGLNCLALDNYEYVQIVPKVLERYRGPYTVHQYPADPDASPHRPRNPSEHDIVVIQDISKAEQGNHSKLNNHAGAAFPRNRRQVEKRCAKPFRELSFRWDGSVAICCNDWRGEYKIGSIDQMPIDDIWNHDAFGAARRKLYHGQRDFGPCNGCDAVSYRVGLLPDKKGNETLPLPDDHDIGVIESALSGGCLTKPVLRPWELTVNGHPVMNREMTFEPSKLEEGKQ